MPYIIRDSKRHPRYEDEDLYVVCYNVLQVGHKADALKYCCFTEESEAIALKEELEKYGCREFIVESVQ